MKKLEKDINFKVSKVKFKGKVWWIGFWICGRWKYFSNDESEGFDSEKLFVVLEEGEEKESEEVILVDDDELCKKCGFLNYFEFIFLCDFCDSGYYIVCFCFFLMIILDGEWFCLFC